MNTHPGLRIAKGWESINTPQHNKLTQSNLNTPSSQDSITQPTQAIAIQPDEGDQ